MSVPDVLIYQQYSYTYQFDQLGLFRHFLPLNIDVAQIHVIAKSSKKMIPTLSHSST